MNWLVFAAAIAASALFIAAISLLVWVVSTQLSVLISQSIAVLQELRIRTGITAAGAAPTSESILGSQLKDFIANRLKPTDGDFITNSDEELYLQEQIKALRDQGGLTEQEIEAFVRQGVTEPKV